MWIVRVLDWLLRRFGFRVQRVVKSVSSISVTTSR